MPTLDARFVERVEPQPRPRRYSDGKRSHGLLLQVQPSGTKQWVQRITVNGKRREFGLGSYPTVSLAEARDMALERKASLVRERARANIYAPAAEVAAQPLADAIAAALSQAAPAGQLAPASQPMPARRCLFTFKMMADEYRRLHIAEWKPGTLRRWDSLRKTHIESTLGHRMVDQITTADVLNTLRPLYADGHSAAPAALSLVRNVLALAIAHRHIETNPAADHINAALPKGKAKRGHHAGVTYQKAPAIYAELRAAPATPAHLALRLVALTAQRLENIRTAKVADFDTQQRTWTIPASETKTGKAYIVPLCDEALEVLQLADALAPQSPYLFATTHKKGGAISQPTMREAWKAIAPNATIHGLRSDFRTWAAERTDAPAEVAEHQLGHNVGTATVRAYRRTTLYRRRVELMAQWCRHLTGR